MGFSRKRLGADGKPRYTAYYWDVRGKECSAGTFGNELISVGEDEGLDGVDERSGLVGAGSDFAEDFPVLQLGVSSFAGAAESGMGGVDGSA